MRPMRDRCFVIIVSVLVSVSAAAQSPLRKIALVSADSLTSLAWTSLASDGRGDGLRPRLPDGKELFYAIDSKTDRVWFKVTLYEAVPERWLGITVAVDSDDKPDNGMTWWGTNKIKFDRVATAFLSRTEDDWQGYVGVADSDAVGRGDMGNLTRDVSVAVDTRQRAISIGIPRSALGPTPTVRIIATVGSMVANNDDVPNDGMVTIKLKP